MILMDNLKVKSFIQAAPFESRLINTFFLKIGDEPDNTLYRIYPLQFAKKHGLDKKKVVNIFILATRAGIFSLFFHLVCPHCGLILIQDKSFSSLNEISHFCSICHFDVPVILDDNVEVVFQIHPDIYKVQPHWNLQKEWDSLNLQKEGDSLESFEGFSRFFFSRSIQYPGQVKESGGHVRDDFHFLSPGETKTFTLNVTSNKTAIGAQHPLSPTSDKTTIGTQHSLSTDPVVLYRFIALNLNMCFLVLAGNKTGHNDPFQVTVNEKGFSQKEVRLNRGTVRIDIKNNWVQKIGISILKTTSNKTTIGAQRILSTSLKKTTIEGSTLLSTSLKKTTIEGSTLLSTDPGNSHSLQKGNTSQFKPFLNGKMVLNNTTFRNLFKIKNLPGNLMLTLRSLTLLFMVLDGSAAMYEKQGDAAVYDHIQDHFSILEEIIDKYNGAIIKTMGYAIMVSFSYPADGFLAAFSMLVRTKSVVYEDGTGFCLNIGLHEGQALVVNRDEQIDYFGRTVTIAARIQNLAGPNEIFFSNAVFRNRDIKKELVKQKGKLKLYKKYTKLKGIDKKITIYKMFLC